MQTLFEVAPALAGADAQAVFSRIHPDDLLRIHRSIEESRAALTPWQATFRVKLPGGRERHLSAHSTPQREADGSVLWHGLATDVTQQVLEREARERLQRERDRAQREAQARAEALSVTEAGSPSATSLTPWVQVGGGASAGVELRHFFVSAFGEAAMGADASQAFLFQYREKWAPSGPPPGGPKP